MAHTYGGGRHQVFDSLSAQTGALHEAFGDLTAIFAALDQLDMCECVIALSKCDLTSQNLISLIGKELI